MNDNSIDRRDLAVFGKLSERTRNILRAVVKSSVAEQAMAEVECENLEARRRLIADLAVLDKSYPAKRQRTAAEAMRAHAALDKAEAAAQKARDEYRMATMIDNGIENAYGLERKALVEQLQETADPRLAEFAFYCRDIATADLVLALRFWVDPNASKREWRTVQHTNIGDIERARAELQDVIAEVEAARLQALNYVDVSQMLGEWCHRLAAMLAPLELNPPTLTAAESIVGRPMLWHGHTQWVVNEEPGPETAEQRKQRSEARASKLANAGG